VKSAQLLRHDEKFVARFGLIVPDMENIGGQGIFMNKMTGASIGSLTPEQRTTADADVFDLKAMLASLLPGRKLDLNEDNLLFDGATGKLKGWMDLFPGE
jgi:hypothetical protein